MKFPLAARIVVGMMLGIATGVACHAMLPNADAANQVGGYFSLLAEVFLRLVKMIIAPLVFCSLVIGVTKIGDVHAVGRIGLRTLGWFLFASFVSLALGALIANWLKPGSALNLPLPAINASTGLSTSGLSPKEFVVHLVPSSIVEAMANNEILQIVVFAAFFSVGLTTLGDKAQLVVRTLEQVSHVMLKVTGYVMALAPFAVFGAIQSRWHDDVLHICHAFHRAGVWRSSVVRAAVVGACDPDADEQRHGRGAACISGRNRCDAGPVQYPRGRAAPCHRRRSFFGHGTYGDQCAW